MHSQILALSWRVYAPLFWASVRNDTNSWRAPFCVVTGISTSLGGSSEEDEEGDGEEDEEGDGEEDEEEDEEDMIT
jgi:hypothetical protein